MRKKWESFKISDAKKYANKFVNVNAFVQSIKNWKDEYQLISSFGFYEGDEILYFIVSLSNWSILPDAFKIDFYLDNGKYRLCLKRDDNKAFSDEEIPQPISKAIKGLFSSYRNDDKCITLIECEAIDKTADNLKFFLDKLSKQIACK